MRRWAILPAVCLAVAAADPFAIAAEWHPDDLVGTSIGTDFLLDPTFGDAGFSRLTFGEVLNSGYYPLRLVADDGGYWLLGDNLPFIGSAFTQLAVARLALDGTRDPSFNGSGYLVASVDLAVFDVALGDQGRFYAAGLQGQPNDAMLVAVACTEADGSPCAGFGPDDEVASVTLDGFAFCYPKLLYRGGSLYVVGTAQLSSSGQNDTLVVAKIDAATAAPDPGFGDGSLAPGTARFDLGQYPGGAVSAAVALFDGDRLLVGGSAQSTIEGGAVGYVLALDATDGSIETGFGSDGITALAIGDGADLVTAKALALRGDGRIAVAGDADLYGGGADPTRELMLAELEPDGTPAADFSGAGLTHLTVGHRTDICDLALRTDGALVVAMSSLGLLPDPESGSSQQSLAEFDALGAGPVSTASIAFDDVSTTASVASAVGIDPEGRVVLAGAHVVGKVGLTVLTEMTATRLVSDRIFASPFD